MENVSSGNVGSELAAPGASPTAGTSSEGKEVVSTHVLVTEEQVVKLRELSRRTRIAQSEYLREAVDDVLVKYQKLPAEAVNEEQS